MPVHRLLPVLLLILAAGCSTTPEEDNRAARNLYEAASAALERGDFQSAVEDYETLESKYPFGRYAKQAQLDIIYAYYRLNEPDSAIAAADRFLRLNPQSQRADYALFMQGVVEQERGRGLAERYFDLDRAARTPAPLERAFRNFTKVVERYPDSDYAKAAVPRMRALRDQLAAHEIKIARFYRERRAWVAVANRARTVLQRYPNTDATAPALQLMARAYGELGLGGLRDDVRRILRKNGIDPEANAG